jgi:hypothetical protein
MGHVENKQDYVFRPRLSPAKIDLPRPRWVDDQALKRSQSAFIAYRNDIWHVLKQQLAPLGQSFS